MEDRVRAKLEHNPPMRGRKEMLVASIWWDELPKKYQTKKVHDVLAMITDKELSSAETIMRSMRKVLESRDAWRNTSRYKVPPRKNLSDVLDDLAKKK